MSIRVHGSSFSLVIMPVKAETIGEPKQEDSNSSFLTYNATAYGISIKYPSNWQIDQSGNEFLLSVLQNLTSESQMTNDSQTNAIKSKVSEILQAFGLGSVSDVVGLNPDKKTLLLQKVSQIVNAGTYQTIVSIISPPEDEFDTTMESMNIVSNNISTVSPMSLRDFTNLNIEGLKSAFEDFTMVQPPKEITIDGKSAMTLICTLRFSSDDSVTVKNLIVLMVNGNTAYVLTFGAIPESYSTYAPTFERMLQSFKIN